MTGHLACQEAFARVSKPLRVRPHDVRIRVSDDATAYVVLHDFVQLRPGDWVGFNLANSDVGQNLIALARRAGIKTLAVVRREDAARGGQL